MSIKKTISFTTGSVEVPPTSSSHVTYPPTSVLPIGEQPEGNLDSLGKLEEAVKSLMKNLDQLQENLKKLKEENKKLKALVGIIDKASAEGRELI